MGDLRSSEEVRSGLVRETRLMSGELPRCCLEPMHFLG